MNSVVEHPTIHWWLLTLQGIASILFGLAAVFWPGLTLGILIYLFSIYILLIGMVHLVESLMSVGQGQAWILGLLLGVFQIGVGVYLVRNPLLAFGTFILLLGFSFIGSAVVEAVMALAEWQTLSTPKVLKLVSAVLSLVVGIYVLTQPVSGGVTFVWVLGLLALINGPLFIAMSLDVKRLSDGLNSSV